MHELTEGIDVVFHLAAIRITQCAEEPRLALEVLVDGTYNVVEAGGGRRRAQGRGRVVGVGLRPRRGVPDTERHHPYANDTLYGAAKVFNEGLLRSFHAMFGLDYVALRYFNVYGPRMDVHGVYTEVLVRWMERIRRQAAADPRRRLARRWTSSTWATSRVRTSSRRADVTDVVFNVASGTETSLLELAQMLLRVMGSDLPVEFGPERAVNGVTRRLADTRPRARRARLRGRGRPRGGPPRPRGLVARPSGRRSRRSRPAGEGA